VRSSAGKRRAKVMTGQLAILPPLEMQRIAPVDQHEDRLQQVIAVGAFPDHMEKRVQLGRRRDVVERADAHLKAGRA
jgi:hypothetical protein